MFRNTLVVTTKCIHRQILVSNRELKRWVRPTLIELKNRKDKLAKKTLGQEKPINRTTFIEWNYNSELYAFGKRLHEDFNPKLLQQAFTHRSYIVQEELRQQKVGIDEPLTNLEDNRELVVEGEKIIADYVNLFFSVQLPKLPEFGIEAIQDYVLSDDFLANVAQNIGTKELILSEDFPVESQTYAATLKAIVGALSASSGQEKAFDFVRDIICTQLNQKDINDLWIIDRPIELLQELCKANGFGEPEPRLIGEVGKNTLLAVYHVGIYCDKQMLSSGFGENVDVAIEVAARNGIRKFFNTDNVKPFNFKITSAELSDRMKDLQQIRHN